MNAPVKRQVAKQPVAKQPVAQPGITAPLKVASNDLDF